MSEVVTFGETMALFTTQNQFGKIKDSTFLQKQIGGAESNVAVALARLGHDVSWVSRVGKDPLGDEIIYRLKAEGVNTSHVIRDSLHPTGLMFKERPPVGDPNVYYYRRNSAASHLQKEDINEEIIRSAKLIHLTGILPALSKSCQEVVFEIIRLAKKFGTKISFDPNLRLKLWTIEEARSVLLEIIKQVDYFFPGVDEARLLLDQSNYSVEEIIDYFLNIGVEQVIVKLGPDGCVTANRQTSIHVKGIKVVEVDSVGAGDGFCAGYLSGILSGLDSEHCAKRANIIGALAVTDPSDYGGYPNKEELDSFLFRKESTRKIELKSCKRGYKSVKY